MDGVNRGSVLRCDRGATVAEYVFLLVFIAIVAAGGMLALGGGLRDTMADTGGEMDSVEVQQLPEAEG